jgi:uncharacterized membrane protein YukC
MARINYKAYDREIDAIENDETLSNAEKAKQIRELNAEVRDSFREEQARERDEAFGAW